MTKVVDMDDTEGLKSIFGGPVMRINPQGGTPGATSQDKPQSRPR